MGAAARTRTIAVPAGTYRVEVRAINAIGTGASSARSNPVVAR